MTLITDMRSDLKGQGHQAASLAVPANQAISGAGKPMKFVDMRGDLQPESCGWPFKSPLAMSGSLL